MPKWGKERFHFHIAPASGTSAQAALDHLVELGATRLVAGHGCPGAIVLADVDGNEFCLVEPQHAGPAGPGSVLVLPLSILMSVGSDA